MPSTERAFLDKHQAAKRLGLNWRSLLLFASKGTLKANRVRDPKTNRVVTMFAAEDVERLRKERASPPPINVGDKPVKAEKQALQPVQPGGDLLLTGLLAGLTRSAQSAQSPSLWLTVEEAAQYAGWPLRGVLDLIHSGRLPHMDFGRGTHGGRYRVKRADLEAFDGSGRQNRSVAAGA